MMLPWGLLEVIKVSIADVEAVQLTAVSAISYTVRPSTLEIFTSVRYD